LSDISPEVAVRQSALGLPGTALLQQRRAYHAGTDTLVLSFITKIDGVPRSRIYLRSGGQEKYIPALNFGHEALSASDPVVCEAPILFMLLYAYEAVAGRDVVAEGHFVGIVRLDLITGTHEIWNTQPRCFFVEISAATAQADVVYGIAGFAGAEGIEYYVAAAHWAARRVEALRRLSSPDF
jgi:hypothetical protein